MARAEASHPHEDNHAASPIEKPRQNWLGLGAISFGFFGIQVGFALQNANMSRVFQSLGSSIDDLAALWVAAPLTGLLVQPVVGHLSDRTWLGRFGRRRPYFLAGAVLAALSLVAMPASSGLLMAALLLWTLDASLNVSMEPFRAFVGDMLRKDQHTSGYGVQTAFIGAGAVIGSLFPYLLDHLGIANTAADGALPDTVRISFRIGALLLLGAVLVTVFSTREYSPEEQARFAGTQTTEGPDEAQARLAARPVHSGLRWVAAGAMVALGVARWNLEKEVYLLAALLAAYGLAVMGAIMLARKGISASLLTGIVGDFAGMPALMKRLAVVQFFSWSALFIMWIHTTPVVAAVHFGARDPASAAYQAAGNWVGVLFSVYNGVAALAALLLLPPLSRRFGAVRTHALCLTLGALGFGGFLMVHDPDWLVACEIGIGIAWASILAMPYAILASSLPQHKLGIYMGLFNVFVVLPQLLVATIMGTIMKAFFPGSPIWTMAFAAASLLIAALAALRVGADSR
ncbi:MFS transporter [Novosphingobium sp. 1949]|uniref:MFS transporter n=1 Tax=Novosphingobium organovorum TaxID=2930092 RepID=A0ABT0B943_9SPHN|nr:MFS transporter [Novosphingobium organovorum]MCJ2181449.1 MFS transporter [Novosphingobium organovorum]